MIENKTENIFSYIYLQLNKWVHPKGFQRKWILLARNCELCKLLKIARAQFENSCDQLRATDLRLETLVHPI